MHVSDSSDGPPEALATTIYEPFVTSKPEGVGLGLALASAAAKENGGSLSWCRHADRTIFTMSLAATLPARHLGGTEDSPASLLNKLTQVEPRHSNHC